MGSSAVGASIIRKNILHFLHIFQYRHFTFIVILTTVTLYHIVLVSQQTKKRYVHIRSIIDFW